LKKEYTRIFAIVADLHDHEWKNPQPILGVPLRENEKGQEQSNETVQDESALDIPSFDNKD
jgi:hypothetical protein